MGKIAYLHSCILILFCFRLSLLLKNPSCFIFFSYVVYEGLTADYYLWYNASNVLQMIKSTSVEDTESYDVPIDLLDVVAIDCGIY